MGNFDGLSHKVGLVKYNRDDEIKPVLFEIPYCTELDRISVRAPTLDLIPNTLKVDGVK